MGKVRGYPQERLRRQYAAFLRTHWRVLAAVVTFEVVVLGLASSILWATIPHTVVLGYILGAAHAATVGFVYYAVRLMFFTTDGSAIHQLRGSIGESNTNDELKRARRQRIIWGWVDGIAVQGGDIDHLVITRRGGLVAVDSKWRGQSRTTDVNESAAAADRARRRASLVLRHLKYMAREHGARHRHDMASVSVAPLVVVWGAAQRDIPAGAQIDTVPFVGGGGLVDWLRDLDGNHIDKRSAAQLQRELEQFRESQGAST